MPPGGAYITSNNAHARAKIQSDHTETRLAYQYALLIKAEHYRVERVTDYTSLYTIGFLIHYYTLK